MLNTTQGYVRTKSVFDRRKYSTDESSVSAATPEQQQQQQRSWSARKAHTSSHPFLSRSSHPRLATSTPRIKPSPFTGLRQGINWTVTRKSSLCAQSRVERPRSSYRSDRERDWKTLPSSAPTDSSRGEQLQASWSRGLLQPGHQHRARNLKV